MTNPELSIIIVNWNGRDFLPDCLQSIVENAAGIPFEIIVVENASTDGSAAWLRSDACSQILLGVPFQLVEPGENLGYGRGNNLGFAASQAPFLFVLNPDTIVTPGSIQILIDTLISEPRIGMTAPKLRTAEGGLQFSVIRLPATPFSILIDGLRLNRIIPKRFIATWFYGDSWTYDERRAVPVVAGAAIMMKREMILDMGGFDESIHMYAEDFELCVRASRRGWKIVFEPSAEIIHLGEKSASQRWSDNDRLIVQEQAVIDFEDRTFSKLLNFANGMTKICVYAFHALRWRFRGREPVLFERLAALHWRNCKRLLWRRRGWSNG